MPSVSGLAALLANCTIEHNISESHVSRRGVGHGNHFDYRWPDQAVPYYFHSTWSPSDLAVVRRNVQIATNELQAMVIKHAGINLSFVDTTDAPPTLDKGKHLLITNAERDCSATVGFLDATGANKMMVKAGWCFSSEVRHLF